MKRLHWLTMCGALLIVAGGASYFNGMAWWGGRISDGWTWQSSYVGLISYADLEGNFPEGFDPVESRRELAVVAHDEDSGLVRIEDHYQVLDIRTKEISWASKLSIWADPETGLGKASDGAEVHVLFPRFTQKQDYAIGFGYLDGAMFSYVREETTADLVTYLFHYVGPMEYTASYAGTEDYEGMTIEAGQEIRCMDDQYIFNIWVEPVTGEIVKYEESCYSGDAIFDIATGRQIQNIARWGGQTLAGAVLASAEQLRWERIRLLFLTRYLWAVLVVLGAALTAMGLVHYRQRRQPVPAPG